MGVERRRRRERDVATIKRASLGSGAALAVAVLPAPFVDFWGVVLIFALFLSPPHIAIFAILEVMRPLKPAVRNTIGLKPKTFYETHVPEAPTKRLAYGGAFSWGAPVGFVAGAGVWMGLLDLLQ